MSGVRCPVLFVGVIGGYVTSLLWGCLKSLFQSQIQESKNKLKPAIDKNVGILAPLYLQYRMKISSRKPSFYYSFNCRTFSLKCHFPPLRTPKFMQTPTSNEIKKLSTKTSYRTEGVYFKAVQRCDFNVDEINEKNADRSIKH